MSLKSKCDTYDVLVKELLLLLNYSEELEDDFPYFIKYEDRKKVKSLLFALKNNMEDFG